jgi:hypothetical protein
VLAFTGFPKDVWTQIWSNRLFGIKGVARV